MRGRAGEGNATLHRGRTFMRGRAGEGNARPSHRAADPWLQNKGRDRHGRAGRRREGPAADPLRQNRVCASCKRECRRRGRAWARKCPHADRGEWPPHSFHGPNDRSPQLSDADDRSLQPDDRSLPPSGLVWERPQRPKPTWTGAACHSHAAPRSAPLRPRKPLPTTASTHRGTRYRAPLTSKRDAHPPQNACWLDLL